MTGMSPEAIAEDPESPERRSNLKAITVIGILAALVVAILVWLGVRFLLRAVEKGTWVKTQTEMGEIQQALNKYAVAHGGSYPATLSDLVPTFGGPLPTDPYTGGEFRYSKSASGFQLECLGRDDKSGGAEIPDRDIIFDEKGMRP